MKYKRMILQIIKQHNEYVKENNIEHGELFHILHAKLKKSYLICLYMIEDIVHVY